MFTIGEFSQLTQLSVKTLRFYHEEGLLAPACVDPDTGYRYYDEGQIETARAIVYLRSLEFPLSEIKEILHGDGDLLDLIEWRQAALNERIKQLRKAAKSLEQFISEERKSRIMSQTVGNVQEKMLEPVLVSATTLRRSTWVASSFSNPNS